MRRRPRPAIPFSTEADGMKNAIEALELIANKTYRRGAHRQTAEKALASIYGSVLQREAP